LTSPKKKFCASFILAIFFRLFEQKISEKEIFEVNRVTPLSDDLVDPLTQKAEIRLNTFRLLEGNWRLKCKETRLKSKETDKF
jgi:hypothetical protein